MSQLTGALIGVCGTVVGASLAGLFALVKGRQESADKERDRLEQRLARQHEMRHAAYTNLLCACHTADDKVRTAWAAPMGAEGAEESEVAWEAARKVRECQVIVGLAGPSLLADLTERLCRKYTSELLLIEALRRGHSGEEGCPADHQTEAQRRETEERWALHDRVVVEGRAVLGGDLPPAHQAPVP